MDGFQTAPSTQIHSCFQVILNGDTRWDLKSHCQNSKVHTNRPTPTHIYIYSHRPAAYIDRHTFGNLIGVALGPLAGPFVHPTAPSLNKCGPLSTNVRFRIQVNPLHSFTVRE